MAINTGLPEGFVLDEQPTNHQLPDGFILDGEQPVNTNQAGGSLAQGMMQTSQTLSDGQRKSVDGAMSLREKVIDSVTGDSKMTPEMESMKNVATAPELNSLSMDAMKAGWSQLFGSDASQQKILESMGGKARQDEKGNVIITLPSGEYALNKPGLSPQDVTSFIANALAFTPAARAASVVGATLKSGATDLALQGITQAAGGEDIDPVQTAMSAGIGGIGKGIENTISTGARATKGTMTAEQQAQIDFANQHNLPLMTSDMLKNKTLNQKDVQTFGDRIPFFGTGKARLNQKQERENLVRTFSDGLGDISDKQLYESATKGQQAFIKAAGTRYEDIINKMGDTPVDLTQTVRAIDGQIANLTRPGASQDRAAVNVLKQFKEDITSGTNNLRMARENRTDLRTRFMNSQDRVSSTSLEKASDSIYAAYTLDMKKAVHQKLGADEVLRMARVDKSWAGFNGLMANTRVQKALQAGRVKPEEVTKLIFSQSAAERSQLYKLLDDNGRNKARSAIVQQAIDKATNSAGDLSVDTFLNEMHRNRKQAATFFRGEHGRQFEGLTRYLDSTRGASKANVQNLNGQQVYGALMGGGLAGAAAMVGAAKAALYIVPIAAATGGAARVYEGRMVRNALMRLANTPKGSTAYDRNISAVTQALTKSAQTAQRD